MQFNATLLTDFLFYDIHFCHLWVRAICQEPPACADVCRICCLNCKSLMVSEPAFFETSIWFLSYMSEPVVRRPVTSHSSGKYFKLWDLLFWLFFPWFQCCLRAVPENRGKHSVFWMYLAARCCQTIQERVIHYLRADLYLICLLGSSDI